MVKVRHDATVIVLGIFHIHRPVRDFGVALSPALLNVSLQLRERLRELAPHLLQARLDDLRVGRHRVGKARLIHGLAVDDPLNVLADDFRRGAARADGRGRDDDKGPKNCRAHVATMRKRERHHNPPRIGDGMGNLAASQHSYRVVAASLLLTSAAVLGCSGIFMRTMSIEGIGTLRTAAVHP